jgi:hypothetical protein
VVRDANGFAVAYVYGRSTEDEAMAAKQMTMDEARRVASNIAKLPEMLKRGIRARTHKSGSANCSLMSASLRKRPNCCDAANVAKGQKRSSRPSGTRAFLAEEGSRKAHNGLAMRDDFFCYRPAQGGLYWGPTR